MVHVSISFIVKEVSIIKCLMILVDRTTQGGLHSEAAEVSVLVHWVHLRGMSKSKLIGSVFVRFLVISCSKK